MLLLSFVFSAQAFEPSTARYTATAGLFRDPLDYLLTPAALPRFDERQLITGLNTGGAAGHLLLGYLGHGEAHGLGIVAELGGATARESDSREGSTAQGTATSTEGTRGGGGDADILFGYALGSADRAMALGLRAQVEGGWSSYDPLEQENGPTRTEDPAGDTGDVSSDATARRLAQRLSASIGFATEKERAWFQGTVRLTSDMSLSTVEGEYRDDTLQVSVSGTPESGSLSENHSLLLPGINLEAGWELSDRTTLRLVADLEGGRGGAQDSEYTVTATVDGETTVNTTKMDNSLREESAWSTLAVLQVEEEAVSLRIGLGVAGGLTADAFTLTTHNEAYKVDRITGGSWTAVQLPVAVEVPACRDERCTLRVSSTWVGELHRTVYQQDDLLVSDLYTSDDRAFGSAVQSSLGLGLRPSAGFRLDLGTSVLSTLSAERLQTEPTANGSSLFSLDSVFASGTVLLGKHGSADQDPT